MAVFRVSHFLQSNSFSSFTFLHLSITLLYYSFPFPYSLEQLHVCNFTDAIVPYIGIECAVRRCSLLFIHPDALPCASLLYRVCHGE